MYKMPVTFLSLCILVFDKKRAQQVCFACRNFCLTRLQLRLPGLQELGVEPSSLDTIAISVLRRHRQSFFWDESIDSDAPCRPTSSYVSS